MPPPEGVNARPLTPGEADLAFAAAQKVVEVHRHMCQFLREGQTLAQVDAEVARVLAQLECRSCFLGYRVGRLPPYPSHACLSVNDCIVHGTHLSHTAPLREGDLLSLDIGVVHRNWVGDAAWTYAIKSVSEPHRRLMACGREALLRGIPTLSPANTMLKWAQTIQSYVEGDCGYHLVRGLGGHGYGRWINERDRGIHGPPYVSNVPPLSESEWPDAFLPRKTFSQIAALRRWQPGTLIAVEPMIALGTGRTIGGDRDWPIHTADGSVAVHYEADVLITDAGPRDLTEGMQSLPDIVG